MHVNSYELAALTSEQRIELCRRTGVDIARLVAEVTPLVEAVRTRGDEAVRELTNRFDGVDLAPAEFRVSIEAMDRAVSELPGDLRDAMETSIANIRAFHERQTEAARWERWFPSIPPGSTSREGRVRSLP